MKKVLFTIAAMLMPMLASADAVEIDGIYYNLNDEAKTAEVTENPNKYQGDVNIPDAVEYGGRTYSVTSIHWIAFSFCSDLTSVYIPGSVTTSNIGYTTFLECRSLTSITVDETNSVYKSIDGVLLTKDGDETILIIYPIGKTETAYTIPDGVTTIGANAFWLCSLTSITIPSSVTSIYPGAFIYCEGLTSITIPTSVTTIGGQAFYGCSGLTSVNIPGGVTSIGDEAFAECRGLTSITVDADNSAYKSVDGVLMSMDGTKLLAYPACKTATAYNIPDGVTSIGNSLFADCTNLTSITIPNSVTSIGSGAFNLCSSLTSITIPNSVTSIGSNAFNLCSSLTSITIPVGVTSIDDGTFSFCNSLTSVTIPGSIKTIGGCAFDECWSLRDFYCYAQNVPMTEDNTFNNAIIANVTLHVPAGAVSAYQAAEPWNKFKAIVVQDINFDLNGDGVVNAADVVKLVNIIADKE